MIKKIPLRKCVISNEQLPKSDLIRIVKNKEGQIIIDETGKINGHGIYLKKDKQIIEQAKRTKKIDKLFALKLPDDIYDKLNDII